MTACGAVVLTVPSFIGLIILLFWVTAAGGNNNNRQNNGEYRPWWDFDLNPEEAQNVKIILDLIFLIIACGTLFVPIYKTSLGIYEQYNTGVLASSIFMFANMLSVSFWYLLDFGRREEEENNNNNRYYNNNRYWMDERELVVYNQKVVSYVVLALVVAFFILAAGIYGTGEVFPQTLRGRAHILAAGQYDGLRNTWSFLSLCNVIVFAGLFIASFLLLGGGEVERMVEEARIVNLILITLHLGIISIVMLVHGNTIFSEKKWGGLGVGLVYGGTKYFSALLLMVCILFANPAFNDRQREEGVWVAPATSIACLVLSLLHFAFSMQARSYQKSIYDANSEESVLAVLEGRAPGTVHRSGDFVRADVIGNEQVIY